jgi:hypothetical protein
VFFVFFAFALCAADAPPTALAHFHHLHLNSTDLAKAIEFYNPPTQAGCGIV